MEGWTPADETCTHCAKGKMRVIVARVSKHKTVGYVDFYKCSDCGNIEYREFPPRPEAKRVPRLKVSMYFVAFCQALASSIFL